MNKYTIYKLTCPNGKVYIGKTIRKPTARFGHGCNYANNPNFYNYIKSVGWENIKVDIIACGLDKESAKRVETENIIKFNSCDSSKGFNRSIGDGTTGMTRTLDERQRISNSLKGEKCYWYGKGKRTSKPIEKTHEVNTKWASCRPIIMLDLNSNIIKEYPAISIASYENNILVSAICNCCKGNRLTAGGYKWKYKEEFYGKQ